MLQLSFHPALTAVLLLPFVGVGVVLLVFGRMNLLLRAVWDPKCHSCSGAGVSPLPLLCCLRWVRGRDPRPGLVTRPHHMRSLQIRASAQHPGQNPRGPYKPWEVVVSHFGGVGICCLLQGLNQSLRSTWPCVGQSQRQDLGSPVSSVLPISFVCKPVGLNPL